MLLHRHLLAIETAAEVEVIDLTPRLRELLAQSGVCAGLLTVSTRHTTTALTINENEPRLLEDLKRTLARLVPKTGDYLHNDIAARGAPTDEPPNAHAHIAAMLLGTTETLPVADGALALGTWQSVLFVELDGPRRRTVEVQILALP
jgi:secondary thiamine-phosphate synthase enzyme